MTFDEREESMEIEPLFLTQWERDDYERRKRGEKALGPPGRDAMLTMDDMLAIVKPHNDKLIAEGRAAELLEVLKAVDHTITVHGHLDCDTPLHKRIQAAIERTVITPVGE